MRFQETILSCFNGGSRGHSAAATEKVKPSATGFRAWLSRCKNRLINKRDQQDPLVHTQPRQPPKGWPEGKPYPPPDSAFPHWPPATPREIVKDRKAYRKMMGKREYSGPRGVHDDRMIDRLYWLYEHIMLDDAISYRDDEETIFRDTEFALADFPDPKDPDPERYVCLGAAIYMLQEAYNKRIGMGLFRDSPAIKTREEIHRGQTMPEEDRPYERLPTWVEKIKSLEKPLYIPTLDGVMPEGPDDPKAQVYLKERNVFARPFHIHFT